jgi:hypothetical protein
MKTSRQIFKKYSNIKFHENPSSGSRVSMRADRQRHTDRHDVANSRFPQFRERAKKFWVGPSLQYMWGA